MKSPGDHSKTDRTLQCMWRVDFAANGPEACGLGGQSRGDRRQEAGSAVIERAGGGRSSPPHTAFQLSGAWNHFTFSATLCSSATDAPAVIGAYDTCNCIPGDPCYHASGSIIPSRR